MTTVPYRSKTSVMGLIEEVAGDREISAFIEIADRCNEVCVHCYQIQGQKGEMSTEQIFNLLDELAEMGILFLTISGGEATLRKDFLEIVAYARKLSFAVKLYTNGLTMTQELAQNLYDLAVQEVQISLYSHRAEMHDWITKVPGSWQKTVNGVKHLTEVGVAVVVKSPVMRMNENDIDAWIAQAQELGADYMLDPTLDPREDGDRTPEAFSISNESWLNFQRDERLQVIRKDAPTRDLDRSVCGACSSNIHIEANGEIRPCSQLDISLGNITETTVKKAWRENESTLAIGALKWSDLHGCRDCDLQPYCGRCFSTARFEAGDALGPYPSACHKARLGYEAIHHKAPQIKMGACDRDISVGPYAKLSEHQFETIEDRILPSDDKLAELLTWSREKSTTKKPDFEFKPGELIQIRRPGKKIKEERIPLPLE